jgi:hypothetical protein
MCFLTAERQKILSEVTLFYARKKMTNDEAMPVI